MFVIVTSALPKETDVSSITSGLDRDNIAWFEIPANNETVKNGKAVARFLSDEEFYTEFIIEDAHMEKKYRMESNLVEKWLKEHHGENINSRQA
jgi:hypothetical protein